MADTGIFATTAEVQRKVGANVSSTSNVEAFINDYITQAESYINVATGKNWSDAYSGLNVDVKGVLKEAASNLAAIYVINYDFTTIISTNGRVEAEDRINVLFARFIQCLDVLREIGTEKFMVDA